MTWVSIWPWGRQTDKQTAVDYQLPWRECSKAGPDRLPHSHRIASSSPEMTCRTSPEEARVFCCWTWERSRLFWQIKSWTSFAVGPTTRWTSELKLRPDLIRPWRKTQDSVFIFFWRNGRRQRKRGADVLHYVQIHIKAFTFKCTVYSRSPWLRGWSTPCFLEDTKFRMQWLLHSIYDLLWVIHG